MRTRESDEYLISYAAILVAQAHELAGKLRHATAQTQLSPTTVEEAIARAGAAHTLLSDTRSTVAQVAWERTKVEDGRTGEDIFDRLAGVIHDLHESKRNAQLRKL